jgi:prophage DNA circulation protein
MSTIRDIHLPFRDAWVQASFRNAYFFVESTARDNGRRIVEHEFPKKELPYAEDMGRRAKTFTIRAYCITHPFTMQGPYLDGLFNIDYRVARDALIIALEQIGPGTLVLNTLPSENVVVTRYRLTEEERFGGYCTFDIEFSEFGLPPQYLSPSQNTNTVLNSAADTLRQQNQAGMIGSNPPAGFTSQPPITEPGPGAVFKARFGKWNKQKMLVKHV